MKITHEVLGNFFIEMSGHGTTILGSVQKHSLEVFKNTWIWHLGMWFNGGHGSTGLDCMIQRCFPTVMVLHSPACGENLRVEKSSRTPVLSLNEQP